MINVLTWRYDVGSAAAVFQVAVGRAQFLGLFGRRGAWVLRLALPRLNTVLLHGGRPGNLSKRG